MGPKHGRSRGPNRGPSWLTLHHQKCQGVGCNPSSHRASRISNTLFLARQSALLAPAVLRLPAPDPRTHGSAPPCRLNTGGGQGGRRCRGRGLHRRPVSQCVPWVSLSPLTTAPVGVTDGFCHDVCVRLIRTSGLLERPCILLAQHRLSTSRCNRLAVASVPQLCRSGGLHCRPASRCMPWNGSCAAETTYNGAGQLVMQRGTPSQHAAPHVELPDCPTAGTVGTVFSSPSPPLHHQPPGRKMGRGPLQMATYSPLPSHSAGKQGLPGRGPDHISHHHPTPSCVALGILLRAT